MQFTQNPIGSDSQLDLSDNAIAFDYAMNSPAALWTDRFGKDHITLQQALKDVGFKPAGFDFVSGGTLGIGDRDKCVFYPTDGYWYSWSGKLPYVVSPNGTPTPAGAKGWKPVEISRKKLYLDLGEYGVIGDGIFDNSLKIKQWLKDIVSYGLPGVAPEGVFLTDSLYIENTPNLVIVGAGRNKTVFSRKSTSPDSAVFRVLKCSHSRFSNFKVVGNNSKSPSGSGFQLVDCGDSQVDNIWADDCGTIGILAIHPNGPNDDLSYLVSNVHITNSIATRTGGGGIQMTGHQHSGISRSFAKDIGTTGIYFKCPVKSCYITDSSTINAQHGFTIGSDYGYDQKAIRIKMSNLSAGGVLSTLRVGNMLQSVINGVSGIQTGDNTDGNGDGIRLEMSSDNKISNVNIARVGDFRSCARFVRGSTNNTVEIVSSDVIAKNAYHAGFEYDCLDNTVIGVNKLGDVQNKRVDGNIAGNYFADNRTFLVDFNNETTKTVTHNLKWSDIPVLGSKVSLSDPSSGMPGLNVISPNSFTISFKDPYTGKVCIKLI